MTKEKCQELHIAGIEYPEKYDGVWEWYCTCTGQVVRRWKIREDGKTVFDEDDTAFDKLCDCCEVPNQD